MTDNPIAAIEEGVKLVPELQRKLRTDHNICLFSDELRTIIAALTAAGEMAAAPPSVEEDVVEKVARAIASVIGDDDWEKADYFINTADDTIQTTQDLYRDLARAALAAIGRT